MMILLKVVHLYPAVPTQAKTQALRARSRSASGMITAALLPPSSKIVRPNLFATSCDTYLPTAVDPVKLIS
jgi:hypothetical protein